MPNFTDKIDCPKCRETFGIQVEINGYGDDMDAVITPLDEGQMTFEEFAQDKLIVLKSSGFADGTPVSEEQGQRREVLGELLTEYQEKKERGWLKK